jgi:hypothetical protein
MNEQELEGQEEEVTEQPEAPAKAEKASFSLDDWRAQQEDKAAASGWKPFDEYVESGGDPAKWRTADAYNLYGEMVGTIKRQEQDFNQRTEGLVKYTQAQLQIQREQLLAQRDAAIEAGDKAQVHKLDKQLDQTNVQVAPTTTHGTVLLEEWNSKNQWINDGSPKASHAHATFARALQQGATIQDAISRVDAEISKHYPARQAKAHIPEGERGRGSVGFKGKSAALTMGDLTQQESAIFRAMPNAWKSEKEFLQAVADDRKAARGDN